MTDILDRLASASDVLDDHALALALAVDVDQLARWREGGALSLEERDRVIVLEATLALLDAFIERSSIAKWLFGINAHLGDRRPVSFLRDGRAAEVIRAIESEKAGAYA
jgi:uncharacterized protein (DUF2384 family)